MRRLLASTLTCLVVAHVACGGGSTETPTAPSGTTTTGLSACAVIGSSPTITTSILHGTTCSSATSSVVLVNLRDKDNQPSGSCSGTVIGPRAVLTAAHCLSGDTAIVRIFPGAGLEIPAESFRPLDPASLDVGVVIASEDINRPAFKLLVSRDARVGEQGVIAGWGKDDLGNGTTLRAATTTISAVSAVRIESAINPSTGGVCSGDSGGPLLLNENGTWAIAGVISATSFGGSCALGTNFYINLRNQGASSFVFQLVPNAGRQ